MELYRDSQPGSVTVYLPKAFHLVLPDGRVIAGAVRGLDVTEDCFELVEDDQP